MDRNNEIWKGQALNIAKDELLNANKGKKLMDLNLLFKRAKQVYYKAFDHDFFEWNPPKEIKEKHDWVRCKKCGAWTDRAHFDKCKCGEPIPPKE